jgi:hypothetical protein
MLPKINILITNDQFQRLNENLDDVLDLYSRMNKGEKLKPSEQDILRAFQKYQSKGGNPEEFNFNYDDLYDLDEREGLEFTYEISNTPFVFTFSEESKNANEIEFFGEVKFEGNEYLGVIATDKKGYIIEMDFYDVQSDEDIRLQNILKERGLYFEIENFFQEEVIPDLMR